MVPVIASALLLLATVLPTTAVHVQQQNHYSRHSGPISSDYEEEPNQELETTDANNNDTNCPLWMIPQEGGGCKCGHEIGGVVQCNQPRRQVHLLRCYCMTYENSTQKAVVGLCPYNCFGPVSRLMPPNHTNLNAAICGIWNRTGRLCGDCENGFAQPVFSYDLKCIKCTNTKYNWLIAGSVALIPSTVLLMIFITLRISFMSAPLNAFIFVSQVLASPPNVQQVVMALDHDIGQISPAAKSFVRVVISFYGFWNLDFFRAFLPPFCLQNLNTRQSIGMDYIVAFYPLVMIVLIYVLIELHGNNCKIVVLLWKPFHRCFVVFRRQWNIRNSVIDAFASFFLLSYTKLLYVVAGTFFPTVVYDVTGSRVGIYSYYDASVELFRQNRYIYVVTTIILLVFHILSVMMLVLYPLNCFQRCLRCCRLRRHAIIAFMDAFQGYYKNGTDGTRDCRYFAAIYLIARIVGLVTSAMTMTPYVSPVASLLLAILAIFTALIRPYNTQYAKYNILDPILILVCSIWFSSAACINTAETQDPRYLKVSLVFAFIVGLLPLVYIIGLSLHRMCCQRRVVQRLGQRIRQLYWKRGNRSEMESEHLELPPYRMATYGSI